MGHGRSLKPGLYALASLDGSPLAEGDREMLGLLHAPEGEIWEAPGIAARACDSTSRIPAAHFTRTPEAFLAFLGYLDEPEELAAQLGVDGQQSPAEVALLALDRFGAAAPQRMIGEWSLLRWSVRSRELTLLASENARDPIYWAMNNVHVAVAPDMLQLGQLPWVGLVLDPQGFALSLSRAGVRRIRDRDTLWSGIYRVPPATREVFRLQSQETIRPAPQSAPIAWEGSFEEAISTLNTLCGRIVGQNMHRYGRSSFLLSGGLDSTLLTVLGAQEQDVAAEMFCHTSVAPDGSGLEDEREFSSAVAQQLGLQVHFVHPDLDASPYRPAEESMAFYGGPLPTSRHYLFDALQKAAKAEGANAVFDGVMGEMTVTEKPQTEPEVDWLRRMLYAARRWRTERQRRASWPGAGFHARFSPEILASLPQEWEAVWRDGMPQRRRLSPRELRGVHPALAKNNAVDTATPQGLRRLLPFRDRRLVHFAAGLPFGFGEHGGQTRAMARAMLLGKVPDAVRLRRRGMPFSPDYERRMAQQAQEARQRIPAFREAGVGHWLELDWLAGALDRLAAGADPYATEQSQAQTTALAAEFLFWCRSRNIGI